MSDLEGDFAELIGAFEQARLGGIEVFVLESGSPGDVSHEEIAGGG